MKLVWHENSVRFSHTISKCEINGNWLNKMQIHSLTLGGTYRKADIQLSFSQINIRYDKHVHSITLNEWLLMYLFAPV